MMMMRSLILKKMPFVRCLFNGLTGFCGLGDIKHAHLSFILARLEVKLHSQNVLRVMGIQA